MGQKKFVAKVLLLFSVGLLLAFKPWPAVADRADTATAADHGGQARQGDAPPAAGSEPLAELLATAYPVGEVLHYDVTWMGLTAGRLTMEIKQLGQSGDLYAIDVTAQTAGMLGAIYPVDDEFRVVVRGERRLPEQYRNVQRHGNRPPRVRVTMYDQQEGRIIYQRDLDEPERYQVEVPIYNEFAAFYAMRLMPLSREREVIVPTFADEERHEVPVVVEEFVTRDSIFGSRETMLVRPQLKFVGLYDKAGDPQIWLTADEYRIPLRIRSRIAIGSLIATLTHYEGPANR